MFTGSLLLMLLVCGYGLFRLYRTARRTTQNLEEVSNIILTRVVHPLTTLPPLMEIGKYVLGLVEQYRSRERRNGDDERE